ncbi:MAG: iron-containing alcohol dehydrogenase [Bacteroidota bacterium]|nr:iron-containing alcohol dehydrogenase [Bacteroidota bacterium]
MNYKKPFYQVPSVIYGNNIVERLIELLPQNTKSILIIYDNVLNINFEFLFKDYEVNTESFDATKNEPYTKDVDKLALKYKKYKIDVIIGVGGGSTMDVAKAVSVLIPVIDNYLSEDFQGWDLVNHDPIYKIGIPTIAGSGSEASRTAVLNNGEKKQGINSYASMFNGIILDNSLTKTVNSEVAFYSAMDCYIHSVESLEGNFINALSKEYALLGLKISESRYYKMEKDANMTLASYFGGVSIVNSEVGICHALSYGLSIEYGIRHGLANCLIFSHLEEFYGKHVVRFKEMLKLNKISLPQNICFDLNNDRIKRLIKTTYLMINPLINALGENYKSILTPEKIVDIYKKI